MKKIYLIKTLLLLFALVAGSGSAWAEDVVYKKLSFPDDNSSNNGLTSNQYISTWTATSGADSWSISNFNNNNWAGSWTFIRCGRKNTASVATITTSAAIDKAITKVVVTIDAITTAKVNSIKLYTSSDNSSWTEAGSFDKATGAKEVALSSPTANLYYKIEFDCASGSGNGFVTVSKIEYYYNSVGKETPVLSFPEESYDATLGQSFTAPTLSNASGVSVSYSSSATSVATVDASTGAVTLVGEGTTTISAAFAGDNNYNPASASYTLIVTDPAVATAITIDASGITNTDIKDGTAAGSLSATVTADGTAVSGATVTWTSSNPAVATINESGVVTLVAAGSTNITATYAGVEYQYKASSATYTLNVTNSTPSPYTWEEATLESLTSSDVFVIVGTILGNTYALTNDNGNNAPTAYSVTVADGKLTSAVLDNLKWNVSGNATDGYTFYPNGTTVTWLYCNTTAASGSNNNMKVGTGDRKLFVMNNNGYLKTKDSNTDRYVSVYTTTPDWRGYVNTTTAPTTIKFYKFVDNTNAAEYYLTGSFTNWTTDPSEMIQLTRNNEGKYTVTTTLEGNNSNPTFKVIKKVGDNITWLGAQSNGNFVINRNSGSINLTAGENFEIVAGEYTFTVEENDNSATLTVTGWPAPKYYLGGNWENGWTTNMVELTENNGVYSCTHLSGNGTQFKFFKTIDGVQTTYGANRQGEDWGVHSEACTNIPLMEAENTAAFQIQMASDHELTFKLNFENGVPTSFDVTGWPISIEGNMFVKVTSSDDLTDGAYLIVNETAGVAFDGSLETLDAANNVIKVNIVDNTIVANSTTKESLFTIVNNGKITSASGSYIGVSSYANSLEQDGTATMYTNSVTFDSDGNADIAINSDGTNYVHLKYNKASDQNRFRYYKSGQQAIQLYKLVTVEEVTITDAEYATFHSESAVDFSETEVTVYTATDNGTTVKLTEVTSGQVPANTPVVLYKAGGGTVRVPVIESAPAVGDNDLYISEGEAYENAYVLAKPEEKEVGFYLWDSSVELNAGKVYLQGTSEGTSGSRQFLPFADATAISDARTEKDTMKDDAVYDLQGRRVAQPAKGLYIVGGRKVIVK